LRRQRVPEEKITVVHNGVDLRRFCSPLPRDEARRRLNLPLDALIVGNIARLAEIKGYRYALEAIAKVKGEWPTLRYVIVGQGSELPMWQAQVRELGIESNVVFLGFRADVPEILSALDVLLFPSLMEAMPMALLEAMAMRLPIVATNVGGIPEVLGKGSGILVPPKDSDAIAGALRQLLKDLQARQRMGAAGRERVEKNFTLELMVDRTLEVYRRLLS
jgi:glycosyltransferase involved in cell wall biosynthesis